MRFPEPYTDDEIRERFKFLYDQCAEYLEEQNRAHASYRLDIDPLVMLSVAKSMMDDIWRYKVYHLKTAKSLSDSLKRAAYVTKWLVRHRPIHNVRTEGKEVELDKKDATLLMNELFSIHISLVTIATDLRVDEILLDPDFHADFLYDLHYRQISEDALLHTYSIIRNAASGSSVVLKVFPGDG